MPTSKNWSTIGVMTIGVSSNQNDVGGSAGEHQNQLKAHGGSFNDRLVQLDGLMIANMACNYSCTGISTNDASTQELSYEFGAISAEMAVAACASTSFPKDGGNLFSGSAFLQLRERHAAGQQRRRRPAQPGHPHRRQHPEDLRYELRAWRADHEGPAVVLDGPSLLGLRAYSGRTCSTKRIRPTSCSTPDPHAARDRNPAEREQRHPPDLADDARRTSCRATSTSRRARPTTGRSAARCSPTPRICRTCRRTTSKR